IERSDDGGATWTDISTGINLADNGSFYVRYVMDPNNPARLVLGTDHVYETLNKGNSWTIIATPGTSGFNPFGDPLTAVALAKSDTNTVYAASAFGGFWATHDDGKTWKELDIPNVTNTISYLAVDPSDNLVVYATVSAFGGGHVFRSANGGQSWTDISGTLADLPTNTVIVAGGAVVI